LMVMGGTPDQLRRVEELIKLYDVPEPQNARVSRTTQPFPIKHSRASVIAEVIKDVYRDLLSANDKALESFNESKNKGRKTEYYGGWGGDREDDGKINQGKFKGLLSVGVDETSNTLIVSCPENLMQSVRQIVLYLDTAALPVAQTMQVLRIDRAIDAASLQKKLADMLKKQTPQKEQQPQQPGQQGKKKGGGQPAQEANEKSDND
jgi:type II secretory pathway component GspD/PulD (secretin)